LEGYQINPLQLNPGVEEMGYGRHPAQAQGDALFQPLECEPTLQIGYALIVDSIIDHFTVQYYSCNEMYQMVH